MAYCKECGAYIPDGQTKCLACGFDETQQPKTENQYSGGFAYETKKAESEQNEQERQRNERREQSRKWAEEEKKRRQEEKNKQKAANREEYAYKAPEKSSTDTSKIFAALSYLSVLFILPYLFAPTDGFAKYHAKQGLVLFVADIIAGIVGNIIGLGWAVTLVHLYLIYKGMMNAINGKTEPLPWIGTFADR